MNIRSVGMSTAIMQISARGVHTIELRPTICLQNAEVPALHARPLHLLDPLRWSTPWGDVVEIVVEPHVSLASFTLRLNNRQWGDLGTDACITLACIPRS